MSTTQDSLQGWLFGDEAVAPATTPAATSNAPIRQTRDPFRLELSVFDDFELPRLNTAHGHKGARAFLPGEDARDLACQAKSMVPARLEMLLTHPDERALLGIIENDQHSSPWRGEDYMVRERILARGLRDANREGVIWTPVLDRLAAAQKWPTSSFNDESIPWSHDPGPDTPAKIPPNSRVAGLIPWIQSQTDPRRLEPLLQFHFKPVHHAVARNATAIDDAFIHRILQDATLGYHLAKNPNLTDAQAATIRDWALDALSESDEQKAQRARYQQYSYVSETSGPAAVTLTALQQAGHVIGDSAIGRILDLVEAYVPSTIKTSFPANKYRYERNNAIDLLMRLDSAVSEQHLIELFDRIRHEKARVDQIVQHPSAGTALWRLVAQETGYYSVREILAANPDARTDPVVRKQLASSSSGAIMAQLTRDAEAEEYARLFRRLVRSNNLDAIAEVIRRDEAATEALPFSDIAPLLEHDETGIRLGTLFWMQKRRFADCDEAESKARFRQAFRSIFRQLAVSEPDTVVRVLNSHLEQIRDAIEPADLSPLLTSSDQSVRLAAITSLSAIGRTETVAHEPDPSVPAEVAHGMSASLSDAGTNRMSSSPSRIIP